MPWGDGDFDQVPGRDRPASGVPVRCPECGYVGRVRRWKYSARLVCPRCRRGKLMRTGSAEGAADRSVAEETEDVARRSFAERAKTKAPSREIEEAIEETVSERSSPSSTGDTETGV
jgi:uncharacterized Zn finger protein (UPF0148 family)